MNQNLKSLSIAAFALVGMLACVKEMPQETKPVETPGVTVTLSTTVNLQENTKALTAGGVKTFAKDEQIAVVYKNTSGNTVKATSVALTDGDITNEGHSAQFTVTLTDPDRSQNVTYIYPAAMAKDNGESNWEALASQDGTLATLASQLDYAKFTGAWTAGALPTGTLDNQLAILALTLKSSDGASVINNEISRLTLFAGTQSYVVTRTPAEGTIYMAIQPTSGTNIQLVAQSAARYYTKSLTDKTYAANNGYPVAFRMAALPEGALPGKFTVASGTQVYFAKGNLQHEGSTWQFAANQWDYYPDSRDMFGYNDWSGATQVSDGWDVLSQAEWNTLINTRTVSNTLQTEARFTLATLGGSVKGLIVFPDHYVHPDGTGFTAGTYNAESNFTATVSIEGWAKMEMAGCMFIPAAGYKSYSKGWQYIGDAVCVSSKTETTSGEYYYTPYFASSGYNTSDQSYKETWSSVRMYKGTAPVTGIALNKTATSIPVGSTETLTATVSPSTAANPGVSWTSNNTAVATVNASTGQITAVAKGTATITATALDGSGATATCTVTVIQEGALTGQFSVSGTKKVHFSKGNLQLSAANTWKFADNQWDYFGTSQSDNHRDLFGWGAANPNNTSTTNSEYAWSEWGENAALVSALGSGWRTLTSAEWTYLLNSRTSVTTRYCKATVSDKAGMVVFPDVYTHPTGVTAIASANTAYAAFTTNSWSGENWTKMEEAGAIFLPAAGYRNGTSVSNVGSYGLYWSSTPNDTNTNYAYYLIFYSSDMNPASNLNRYYGYSVRLVYPVVPAP